MKKTIFVIAALCILATNSFAEDSASPEFQAGISLGTDVLINSDGSSETWNNLGFQPDLALGPFGIGLDLTVRFKLMPDQDTALEVYPGDWIPTADKSFLDLYLPKMMYVRYGYRGDPIFAKLGSIDDLTLGNGFIVGEYSNTKFLPTQRITGLDVAVDGALFKFPYVGLELLTGNLARLDVLGGRLFVRPLIGTEIPILKNLQAGATLATDRKPGLYSGEELEAQTVFGTDLFLPLITNKVFPLATFAELAFEPNSSTGFMIGAGGRLVSVITYAAQLRILGAGFSPVYFDANYDLFRSEKAKLMTVEVASDAEGFAGWLAKAGASLFEDKLYFSVSVDGPFNANPDPASLTPNSAEYPHLRGVIGMADGILGGFFVSGSYDKYFIDPANFFSDLVDPADAVITAALNYKTGAAVFTLLYNLSYNPDAAKGFDVTSSLQSSIKF